MADTSLIPVLLAQADTYSPPVMSRVIGEMLQNIGFAPSAGETVLVKPNFLKADRTGHICTNANVIAGACRYLLDHRCTVVIGDSPGFGTASGIARTIRLPEALAAARCLGIKVVSLDNPVSRPLSCGGSVGISRYALDADRILDTPKLKAHSQMRVTLAVKNLFGCVSGLRKAVLHTQYGDKEQNGVDVFPSAVADILGHLPPVTALMDGILAMHVTGPGSGTPYRANILAASPSPVALDTAMYGLLGTTPDAVPLWRELQRRALPGALPQDITLQGESADSFDFSDFILPETLMPQTFHPGRLLVSTARRVWAQLWS